MILDTISATIIVIFLLAFLAEYISATLGMGYGIILTPSLLLMDFSPLEIVPAVLISQSLAGILAAVMHHRAGNVLFDFRNDAEHEIVRRLGKLGYIPRSIDSKVALVLGLCGAVGVAIAVVVAVNIPTFYLKLFIGILILVMGIVILVKHKAECAFSWKKIIGLGVLAAFNKGMSGGGYGPLVTSGQILSGVKVKSSIAITSFAEVLTCFVGALAYLFIGTGVEWGLAPSLIAGSLISVPFSVYTVKKMQTRRFTLIIGLVTTALGIMTLLKVII